MNRIIILGSAHAVAAPGHENTHMLFQAGSRSILVDCPGSPVLRLRQAGIDPLDVTDLVVTHFHPDHVSGLPLLMIDLWLLGKTAPLQIYGLDATLNKVEQNLELYGWKNWPGIFPVEFHRHPGGGESVLLETEEVRLRAAEVCHLIPTLGLRLDFPQKGRSAAYSCDTEPCEAVVELARSADVLLHESAANAKGHTSPTQAGEIAARAGAKALYLIHYPPGIDEASALADARISFNGPVALARDLMEIELG